MISDVDIQVHQLTEEDDFILLGCDGIFDRLSNRDIVDVAWKKFREKQNEPYHDILGHMIDQILKEAIV